MPIVARGLVAVIIGSALSLGAATAASAHTPNVSADCSALTVNLTSYNADGVNSVAIEVDGAPVMATTPFGASFAKSVPFSDKAVAHTYTVTVVAHDDPASSKGWSVVKSGTSTPCVPPTPTPSPSTTPTPSGSPSPTPTPTPTSTPTQTPTPPPTPNPTPVPPRIALSGTACTEVGGDTDVTAILTDLRLNQVYRVEITSDGKAIPGTTKNFTARSTTASYTWPGLAVDRVYVVSVTLYRGETVTATFTPEPCPIAPEIAVATQPCLVPGGTAGLEATASELVAGREYTLSVAGASIDPITFIAGSASETRTFGVTAPGSGYVVTVLDTASGLSSSTAPVTVGPCPRVGGISIEVTECSLGQATGTVGIVLDGLTVGAGYQVEVDGVPSSETPYVATGSTLTVTVAVAPGTHSIRAYDTASPGYVLESTVTVVPCPVTPTVAIDAAACTTPAGTGSITAMLSDLVAGRSYTVEVLQDGQPVAGVDPVVVVGTGPQVARVPALPQDIVFEGLAPGTGYSVRVVDVAAPEANAEAEAEVGACPPVPSIAISITGCDVVAQVSEVTLTPTDLIDGEAYTARLDELTADGPVARDQINGITDSTPVTFSGVGNGRTYLVTVANEGGDLSASQSITLEECGSVSPTPPLTPPGTPVTPGSPLTPGTPVTPAGVSPTDVTTLAATGTTDGTGAIIAALFALQLGVILVGARVLRSRRHS